MSRVLFAGALLLGLAACQPEEVDVFCKTHQVGDLIFSRQAVNAMTSTDKRKYAKLLLEAERLCGWKPPN